MRYHLYFRIGFYKFIVLGWVDAREHSSAACVVRIWGNVIKYASRINKRIESDRVVEGNTHKAIMWQVYTSPLQLPQLELGP